MIDDIRYRLRALFHRDALDRDLSRELESQLADRADHYRAQGITSDEAMRRARIDLGGSMERIKDDVRQTRGISVVETAVQDIRYALRGLLRAPTFTIAAVLALGLGVGSATAVFSLVEGVVLRPLAYRDPGRLVTLRETNTAKNLDHQALSPVTFLDYRALNGSFADAAGWWRPQVDLTDESTGDPSRVNAVETSRNLFRVLGIAPAFGRTFTGDSTLTSPEPEVIISHRLWQLRFGGDSAIVGRTIRLNGGSYTVIGVMAQGFSFPDETDVWQGLDWDFAQHRRGARFLEAIARLRPGATVDQVERDLEGLNARLGTEFRATNEGWRTHVYALDREVVGVFRPGLFALFGAAALLLLLACINVANLLLARATTRRREVALRAAIGATRSRLARLFLTESLVLAVAGVAVGLGVAFLGVRALVAWSPVKIPRAELVGVNVSVLIFATLIAVATSVMFGLVPAFFFRRADVQSELKEGARGTGGRSKQMRSAFVVAEVALAVVLLSGAGLMLRSVTRLLGENTGVDPVSVISADVQLSADAYRDWARVDAFYTSLLTAIRARPEIVAAGTTEFLPLESGWRIPFFMSDAPPASPDDAPLAQWHVVDEGYFKSLRVPLLAGREFDGHDNTTGTPVVIVNETFVREFVEGGRAVGRSIVATTRAIGPLGLRTVAGNTHEIVGVVGDVKNKSLKTVPEAAIYFSSHQFPFRKMFVVVRSRGRDADATDVVRAEMKRLDPALPLANVRTMTRVLAESVDPPRFIMSLMMVFAVLALILAAVGVYGLLSYTVANRSREMGIRLALGARPMVMFRNVIGEGVLLAVIGSVIGLAGAFAGGRAITRFLYGIPPWDPMTLGTVVVAVSAVAAIASIAPGRRASGADPATALRSDA